MGTRILKLDELIQAHPTTRLVADDAGRVVGTIGNDNTYNPIPLVDSTGNLISTARDGTTSLVSGAGIPRAPYLTKALIAFVDTANDAFANDWSTHVQMTTEAEFDAVQVGFINTRAGSINVQVAVSVMTAAGDPSTTAVLNSGGTWVNAGSGGTATLTCPAATVTQYGMNITWGDVIPLASVARSDGGTLPLLCVRTQQLTANNGGTNRVISAQGGAAANGYAFETDNTSSAPYGRLYRVRSQASVQGVTTISSITTTSNGCNNAPPIIVRYFLRNGYGRSLALFGDSLTGALNSTTFSGWSPMQEARRRVSTTSNPLELCVLAQSGGTMAQIATRVESVASTLTNVGYVTPIASPNSLGVPITAATVAAERANYQRILTAAANQKAPTISWTMLPANYAAKAWGATDSLRLSMNATRLAGSVAGALVVDPASLVSGPVDGNSQTTLAYAEADGLHLPYAGNVAAGAAFVSPFRAA